MKAFALGVMLGAVALILASAVISLSSCGPRRLESLPDDYPDAQVSPEPTPEPEEPVHCWCSDGSHRKFAE